MTFKLFLRNKTLAVEAVNMESNNNVAAKLFRGIKITIFFNSVPIENRESKRGGREKVDIGLIQNYRIDINPFREHSLQNKH